ncbi:hypothetical protein R1flu_021956 [Riccia fluitans]|uniref:Uncharacterized protein n=1 Tax=Riccia fluitans TaxID=41844 RepID=A0ABD1ZQW1_9MARC
MACGSVSYYWVEVAINLVGNTLESTPQFGLPPCFLRIPSSSLSQHGSFATLILAARSLVKKARLRILHTHSLVQGRPPCSHNLFQHSSQVSMSEPSGHFEIRSSGVSSMAKRLCQNWVDRDQPFHLPSVPFHRQLGLPCSFCVLI